MPRKIWSVKQSHGQSWVFLSQTNITFQGTFVRYGPNQLLVNSPTGIKDIYGAKGSSEMLKSKNYNVMTHVTANTFTHRGGKDHLRRRRIMSLGVSGQAMREYEPRVMSHIDKLSGIVFPERAGEWSKPRNMATWCDYLSFDMMADIIFGAHYNLLADERFRYVPAMIEKSNVRVAAMVQFPDLSWLRLDRYMFRSAIVARNRFLKFVLRLNRDRTELSKGNICGILGQGILPPDSGPKSSVLSTVPDVYSKLEESRDPQKDATLRPDEIASESITLVVAGSHTSACTMSSALFYLADNSEAYAKAAEEVRGVVHSHSDINTINLSTCTYLRACIDEALRMSPAVGSALVREVMSQGGASVGGEHISPGQEVGSRTYAIHHNKECFPEPFTYRPERWLQEYTDRESIDKARSCFAPFSIGTRSCLGKGIAYAEITLTMATLLFQGDFKFADGELGSVGRGTKGAVYGRHRENEYQLYDHIAGQKYGPWLQFSKRAVSS
jgi:cytochrome P450